MSILLGGDSFLYLIKNENLFNAYHQKSDLIKEIVFVIFKVRLLLKRANLLIIAIVIVWVKEIEIHDIIHTMVEL